MQSSDGSGSKIFDPGWVNFCGSGWVSYVWFGFGFGKFPLKISNFSIFSFRVGSKSTQVKSRLTSYLVRVKSKLGPGQGPSLIQNHLNIWSYSPSFCFV